jgi:hypothetical protein
MTEIPGRETANDSLADDELDDDFLTELDDGDEGDELVEV